MGGLAASAPLLPFRVEPSHRVWYSATTSGARAGLHASLRSPPVCETTPESKATSDKWQFVDLGQCLARPFRVRVCYCVISSPADARRKGSRERIRGT